MNYFKCLQVPLPSEDKVKSLFQQLTPGQVDELVSKYRVDLDMYQYSPKQYYSYLIWSTFANKPK